MHRTEWMDKTNANTTDKLYTKKETAATAAEDDQTVEKK